MSISYISQFFHSSLFSLSARLPITICTQPSSIGYPCAFNVMQETILALGALMIIMLIAINQQRSTIHIHEQAYVREISQARDDFAISMLEGLINEKNFDEAAITLTGIPTDPNTMSSVLGPDDLSEVNDSTFDDIDDFHAYRDTFLHVISADTFFFDVTFNVTYLTGTNTVSSVRTFTKEITATVDPLANFGKYGNSLRGQFSKTMVVADSF